MYENGLKPSAYTLIKIQNSVKKDKWPWMLEVGKCAPQYAIHNLEAAFKGFFNNGGYPKRKKKGLKDSFVACENHQQCKFDYKKIWIPRLGWVKMCEELRFAGRPMSVTIKRKADKWFASVLVDVPVEPMVRENQSIVGIDLGISALATLSDGTKYYAPKPLSKMMAKLKLNQRWLSRKQKGSKNRYKQRMRVSRLHYRIGNIRNNFLHQVTSEIMDKYDTIVLEDLKVKNMVKNHKLSQALHDVSLSEYRRQIEYKAQWYGAKVIIADQWFPSSKLCSHCGSKVDTLPLDIRQWCCPSCNTLHDRDINAALNLVRYPTSKFGGSNACGDGEVHAHVRRCPSEKQEVKTI